jgi:hypothetical protein
MLHVYVNNIHLDEFFIMIAYLKCLLVRGCYVCSV